MTKIIKVCIANSFDDEEITPVIIKVTEKLPKFNPDISVAPLYQAQAEQICKALRESLPQGVFDRLWIELAKTRISLYGGLINEE